MINQAGSRFETDKVFVGVLTIAAAGVALVELIRRIERRVDVWRPPVASMTMRQSSKRRTSGLPISSRAPIRELVALDGVNLQVMDGEFVAIVGPSGCGKTTFLSVVDGLIAATGGRVLVDGEVVTQPGPDRAVVFQDASLLPWRTVLGNVRYGLECLGVRTREAGRARRSSSQLVGLSGFEHHYPHELSGGMQQRVNLARALVDRPENPADGRAVRLARCADPRADAGRAHSHLGAGEARPCCSSPTRSTRRSTWPTASWCSPADPARSRTASRSTSSARGRSA